jgi:hypothetical protein
MPRGLLSMLALAPVVFKEVCVRLRVCSRCFSLHRPFLRRFSCSSRFVLDAFPCTSRFQGGFRTPPGLFTMLALAPVVFKEVCVLLRLHRGSAGACQ